MHKRSKSISAKMSAKMSAKRSSKRSPSKKMRASKMQKFLQGGHHFIDTGEIRIREFLEALEKLWETNKNDPLLAETREVYKRTKPAVFLTNEAKKLYKQKLLMPLAYKLFDEERTAKGKLWEKKRFDAMTPEKQEEYLSAQKKNR
jgi:hypothetical protein